MVRERQSLMLPNRLNFDRLDKWDQSDPNLSILKSLVNGMVVPVDINFIPVGVPSRGRNQYLKVAPAVNKMIASLVEQGLVILLPTNLASTIKNIHYSPISWVPKYNKAQGRPVIDSSWIPPSGVSLNSPSVTEEVEHKWGKICHPTIHDLVEMVLQQVDKFGWDHVVLWKMDLANAFGLLFLNADSAPLMAFELTGQITALYIAGIFGWTGTPFAFDPVSRSLRYVVRRRIAGGVDVFVDDLMGCSSDEVIENDMSIAGNCITDLLGPKALATDKTESGRVLVFIGWFIDLDKRVVGIAQKNIFKAIHGFFSVNIHQRVTLKKLQQLSSYASRYSLICRPLLPFVHSLYRNQKYHGCGTFLLDWEMDAQLDVLLWRAFLCLVHLRPEQFCRPLVSFRSSNANLSLEFDASLKGFGVIIGREIRYSGFRSLWCSYMINFGFKDGDASYQNSMEFIAIVCISVLVYHYRYFFGVCLSFAGCFDIR